MKKTTIDFLDEKTRLNTAPKGEIEVPIPGTQHEQWMYAVGYVRGYLEGLNQARTVIKQAVDMDKGRR